ncbi:MAG: hypothetical protein V4510_04885 [bacterium]
MPVSVSYDIREPETHLVRVTVRYPAHATDRRSFRMPAWVPGSYRIRDFGRNVQDLGGKVAGHATQVEQVGKDEWVVLGCKGKVVELSYRVYARELSVGASHVTADHAHLFAPTLVLYDEHSRGLPHRVVIRKPAGWRVWSGLETARHDGTLDVASDYDHLIDCPIECGPPAEYHVGRFDVAGRRHRLVVWKPTAHANWRRILRDVASVCRTTIKIWGQAPYEHYTFIAHVADGHGGGLEHRNSTVLGLDPNSLVAEEKIQANLLPLVAHEFFHTWNVKRVLPAAFQPYDLQRETYTDLLWLFEGFTSYYELPILHRAKVVDAESWAKQAAEMMEFYEKALGRRRLSVAQASRLTWTLLYQPHEHNINRNVSYYTKGLFVGLCLDAHLRMHGVADGLDRVMQHMWRKHGRTGMGLTEDAFPDVVEQATGLDVRRVLAHWVDGTQELPIEKALHDLGWKVQHGWKEPKKRNGLGIQFKAGTTQIERIPEDVPAFKVLQPDDEVVAAQGYKWKADRFADWAAGQKKGTLADVVVFREGRLRTLEVPLVELPKDKISITLRKGDAAATRRRKAWLGAGKSSKAKGGSSPDKPRRTVRY